MAISKFEKDSISTANTPISDQNDPVIEFFLFLYKNLFYENNI
jgi:hypothetical protein